MPQFKHGLYFGCFDNMGLCLLTYFVPCYVFGKNAEAVGESCFLCGLAFLVPLLDIAAMLTVRGKIRKAHNIDGNFLDDLCTVCACTFCAIVQEAQEVSEPTRQGMARS